MILFGRLFITESASDKPERLDILGMVLSAVAVVLIVFPLTQGAEHDWPLWSFLLLIAGELVGVAVAVRSAGRFGRRLPQTAVLFAVAAVVVFILVITRWQDDLTMVIMATPLVMLGGAFGAVGGPVADLSLQNVAHEHAGAASGLFNTSIHLGMALGTALTGLVFFSVTGGSTDATLNREAFTRVLWTVAGAFLVMWLLMFLFPRQPGSASPTLDDSGA